VKFQENFWGIPVMVLRFSRYTAFYDNLRLQQLFMHAFEMSRSLYI